MNHTVRMSRRCRTALRAVLAGGLLLATGVAVASPPPWAPAWGYRGHYGHGAIIQRHEHYHYGAPAYAYAPPVERHEHHHYYHGGAPGYGPVYGYAPYPQPAGYYGCGNGLNGAIGGALGGFLGSKVGKGSGKLAATAGGTFLGYLLGQGYGCR